MWFQHFFVALTIGMLSSYFFKCRSAYFINVLNKIIICSLYAWGLHFYTLEIFWDWSFWTVVLEKTPESPLDCKDIKSVYLKGNQPLIFIGRTDAEAEAPILWTPDAKRWLTRKDPGGGKDWGQEKGVAEDEMVGWHHQLNGHEFEQPLGDGEGQESLVCCSPWGCKESDMPEPLNK